MQTPAPTADAPTKRVAPMHPSPLAQVTSTRGSDALMPEAPDVLPDGRSRSLSLGVTHRRRGDGQRERGEDHGGDAHNLSVE